MDRKAELERKKAKLAAIREEKERRRREKEAKDMEDATNKLSSGHDKDSTRYDAVVMFEKCSLCVFSDSRFFYYTGPMHTILIHSTVHI